MYSTKVIISSSRKKTDILFLKSNLNFLTQLMPPCLIYNNKWIIWHQQTLSCTSSWFEKSVNRTTGKAAGSESEYIFVTASSSFNENSDEPCCYNFYLNLLKMQIHSLCVTEKEKFVKVWQIEKINRKYIIQNKLPLNILQTLLTLF